MRIRHVLAAVALFACGAPSGAVVPIAPTAGSTTPSNVGAAIESLPFKQVACGDFHSCALKTDGTVDCWGRNKSGELGDGTDVDRSTPTRVFGVTSVVEIALGANFSCARLQDGSVSCWGSGRILGDNKLMQRLPPTKVSGLGKVVELHAGGYMTCTRDDTGKVKCWGLDANIAAPPANVKSVTAAAAHACARVDGDQAKCWGAGAWSTTATPTYAKPSLEGVTAVSTGDSFGCALLAQGAVSCWGRNDESDLGTQSDDDNHVTPTAVPGVRGAIALSSSESHTCALLSSGKLMCWGSNSEGELARGTQTTGEPAALVADLVDVTQVAMGADHGCALTKTTLVCWGANRSGQVGDGTTERRLAPAKVLWH